MKKLGFRYKVSSKLGIPLDGTIFVAERAYFLRIINDLRCHDVKIFFQDEIWPNAGDERRSVWKTDEA